MAAPGLVQKTEEEWRAVLSPEQFRILREKGTELKGTGEYDKFFEEGVYNCAGCGTPLYKSTTKFDSGCGWPAFFEGFPGAITRTPDPDGRRTEITCTLLLLKGTGEYDKFFEEGVYNCAGCGTPLYKSTTKFNSGCGWPAFFEGFPGAITRTPDPDGRRTEITCTACGGHLGHVFKGEGFKTPTDERHCVNSVSIKFAPENSAPSL
uniref:MsrB domain-containing protein n=1 Tax=Fagus sylvatica TaxID=28930 RepID=A0A2N9IUC4_FAGSY